MTGDRVEAEDCGRLVQIARNEKGWSPAQLAEAVGVTEAEVEDFEAGRVSPVEPMLSTYLRATGHAR